MLNWIITFFVIAVLASILGFGGIAGAFSDMAQFLALLFLALFLASLIYGVVSGKNNQPIDRN